MKQIIILPLLIFLNWGYGLAQSPTYAFTSNNLPEPNSAAGAFVGNNYTVDLFTGIANVSVPIYGYGVDGLNLGVSLNYNTKGITVDQVASELGLGWDLLAGGRITRYVNGLEDEYQTAFSYTDKETDYYVAEFGGRVEKFLFLYTATPTFPKSEIVVAKGSNVTINGTTYNTWKLTDEKGNVFEFNKVNYLWKVFNGTQYYPAFQWMLTKITTYSGQVVTYTYSDYELNYVDYRDQLAREIRNAGTPVTWQLYSVIDTAHVWHGTQSHLTEIDYPNGDKVNFSMASSTAKRCDLFNNYYLDSITVSSSYDAQVKNSQTFRFNYAYFSGYPSPAETPFSTSCSSASDNLRLKLKSIVKAGNDHGVAEPYYTFDYSATQVPKRMTQSQDWFGYYNGKVNNGISFNSQTYFLGTPPHYYTDVLGTNSYPIGNDRSSDITYMQAGILNKVVSGKGGEMDLYYKAHSLSDAPTSSDVYPTPSTLEATGANDGLCVDHIDYKDGFNQDYLINTFSFSNGLRFYKGGYFWYAVYFDQNPLNAAAFPNQRYYTNHFITPYDFFNNSNHGYSNVTVATTAYKSALGSTVPISTVKYQFTNIVNEVTGRSRLVDDKTLLYKIAYPRDTMRQSEIGLLMKKEVYDNVGHLTSKDTLQYEKDDLPVLYGLNTRTILDSFWNAGLVKYDSVFPSRNYTLFDMSLMRLKYKTSTTFSASKSFSNTIEYDYDGADNVTNLRWTDSRGVNFNKYFKYSYNYVFTSPSGPVYYLPGLQFLATTELLEHTTGSDSAISIQTIRGVQNSTGLVFPYTFESTSAVPFFPDNAQDGQLIQAGTIFDPNYVLLVSQTTTYDDHNNPLETQYLGQQKYSSAIWDTRIGKKIASANNAKYSEIAYTSFEGTFLSSGTDYNKGNWNFSTSNVTFVPYTASIQPVTGRYYFHLSSSAGAITSKNTLTSGKQYLLSFWAVDQPTVTNGSTTVTLTSQATKGSWHLYSALITGTNSVLTISYSSVTDIDDIRLCPSNASMSTYTYEPLFGISSETDERNNIIYHDYDHFGRETVTRDINGNVISLSRHIIHGSDN